MEKTVVEFFAGIGLMRLGLEQTGWQVKYANDISSDKETLYTSNFGRDHFVRGDIHELATARIPTATLATASFPCTDLSLAGGRAGLQGKESSAFWGFIRILSEFKEQDRIPPLVLLENVVGFLTSHQGADLHLALQALNRLGYAVDAIILDAAWFVPQSRQRLFIIGVQREYREKAPSSLPLASPVRPKALVDFMLHHPDISWCITPLPSPPSRTISLAEVLEELPDEHSDWWSKERADYLLNQMSDRHRSQAEEMRQAQSWSYGTVFRRMRQGKSMAELRTDGIAGCLRTPKGGSARQILVRLGYGRYDVRLLTGRECARLMGTPDSFLLEVPLNQALFAFGDAVCVPVVTWLSENYLIPLYREISVG
ncbi:DNA (cytosine-5-)-methyltransferase [Armatimonas sp.]|uniref:DNA cytosine methyltransferase n=1 Tax=Armatimonas sp. TaxID=1872638 RepID=UPI00286B2CF9|nr:DNA (cytosine-5-)-methyltransferase [Armatimonas sp.]